ncbi:MAG: glucose-1-phosphate adenylyltransferase [Defluviitaleaceae bacterium]|nr:glucose-1-phosphate adenylyltransferase [Defluviitaleaceae bacterium]
MRKKEMIAMLLAGGQGSRLGVLTKNKAKPAVAFGGKYRLIDFPMSNCINSGVDTVGVLTQYRPLQLNQHIGIGIPWDLDRRNGGATILAPYQTDGEQGHWYRGTADAIYQNISFVDSYNPDHILVIGGDHIYRMDYAKMLDFHKKQGADATIAVLEVPWDEASRLGIMNCRENGEIYEFEEKPKNPKSNLASMGIYIFSWPILKEKLIRADGLYADSDFGKHIIPMMLEDEKSLYAYAHGDYWKDVGTIESYWEANMDLTYTLPTFNLYDYHEKIYTYSHHQPPQFIGPEAHIQRSLISEGCEVLGTVVDSVLGPDVKIGEGAEVRGSIIMQNTIIGDGCIIERCIIDEGATIGRDCIIGRGEDIPNKRRPKIYNTGITVVGEGSAIPDGVAIGKNCVIYGQTDSEHYKNMRLDSGDTIELEGEGKS